MKEHEQESYEKRPKKEVQPPSDETLEADITRTLQEQASHIHFTATARDHVMQQLSPHAQTHRNTLPIPSLTVAIVGLVLLISITSILSSVTTFSPSRVSNGIQYIVDKTYLTPVQLTHNGQLISIDPTGRHIVYGIASQPGVMYTTSLNNPINMNVLAMRDAREANWSPDGRALVTTIYPMRAHEPQLALVPIGKYMYLLGHEALSASWMPSTKKITYVTFKHGATQVWTTSATGRDAQVEATLSIPVLVQHIVWSPDGHQLALLASTEQEPSASLFNDAGQAIYLMNSETKAVVELFKPSSTKLSSLVWSPSGHILTYISYNPQNGRNTLDAFDTSKQQLLFAISLSHAAQGFCWSPDSRVLLYSEGGILHSRVLFGRAIQLPHLVSATYPLWMNSTHILYIQTTNGISQLTQLRAA